MKQPTLTLAGFGSRSCPSSASNLISRAILDYLTPNDEEGHFIEPIECDGEVGIRTGDARGADDAVAIASADLELPCYRYSPTDTHESLNWTEALRIAEELHPNWKACKPFVRKLMARSVFIILGPDCKSPADHAFVWDAGTSGTRFTLSVCKYAKVDVTQVNETRLLRDAPNTSTTPYCRIKSHSWTHPVSEWY